MEVAILIITFLCLIFSIIRRESKSITEKFNAGNKLPTSNTVSQASRTLADHNSIINNINLEPMNIIEDGKTSFMVPDAYNDRKFPDMKNNIDNLSYNGVKDVLFEVKNILNKNKSYICFNETKISRLDVPLDNYERLLKYIFGLVTQLCSKSFKIIIKSVDKLNTYIDLNNVYYVNFNLTATIYHPMDKVYKKKSLDIPINLTTIIDFTKNNSTDANTYIFIKDFNVIH